MEFGSLTKCICGLLIISILPQFAVGQEVEKVDNHCGTVAAEEALIKKDPSIPGKIATLEAAVQQYISNHPQQAQQRSSSGTIIIPVVVHVINDGEPIGCGDNVTDIANISDAQVLSEIGVLNLDYSRQNADTFLTPDVFKAVAADMGIQFTMAVRDPKGRPTNGVDRVNAHSTAWSESDIDNTLKPSTIWDWDQYLNIWTVNFAQPTDILGYTIIPGASNGSVDGVVVGFPYYGNTGNVVSPYNTGRTATHETGHWFGLYHPWGKTEGPDDDTCDGVGAGIPDVPPQANADFGCPDFPYVSCSDGPNGDMFMNYMDYTNDGCMNIFTKGQAAYAHGLVGSMPERDSVVNSLAGTRYQFDAAILNVRVPGVQVCTDSFTPVLQISNEGSATLTSCYINYDVDASNLVQIPWTGNLATAQSTFVTLNPMKLSPGAHSIAFFLSSPDKVQDQFTLNDGLTINFTVVADSSEITGQPLPLSEGFESDAVPAGWTTTHTGTLDAILWQPTKAAGANGSSASLYVNNYTGSTLTTGSRGNTTDLILPPVSIDPGQYPYVSFDVAYAQYDTSSSDFLLADYSLDCGNTWYNFYSMGGTCLMTAPPVTTAFVPSSGDWQQQTIGIPELVGQNNVMIRFEVYSDNGNNIYLDNVNITETLTGINNVQQLSFGVVISPNPSTGKFTATFDQSLPANSSVEVFDMLGRSIYFDPNVIGSNTDIDLSGNSSGIYIAKIVSGTSSVVKKLVIR